MSAKIRFTSATATGLVLAKVGHPQRDEPLQTSKEVFKIAEEDRKPSPPFSLNPSKTSPPTASAIIRRSISTK